MTLLATADSKRSRYFPGVSPSSRSGITSASRLIANELDLLRVPGEPWRGECGSELCLKRERLRNPPKLDRPVVEIEFLPLAERGGGVSTSRELRPKLLIVEDLSRMSSRIGGCKGDEVVELCELCRSNGCPGSAKERELSANAALGEDAVWESSRVLVALVSVLVCLRCSVDSLCCSGVPNIVSDSMCVDARGVANPSSSSSCRSGGRILIGSGKRVLRFLFLRGNLKNVV